MWYISAGAVIAPGGSKTQNRLAVDMLRRPKHIHCTLYGFRPFPVLRLLPSKELRWVSIDELPEIMPTQVIYIEKFLKEQKL